MIVMQLHGVNFGVQGFWESEEAHDAGDAPAQVVLALTDPQSGIQVQVPFSGEAWVNFQRHVERNGEVPAIEVHQGLPQNGPRMDIPRG